jgi:hypothetical protein
VESNDCFPNDSSVVILFAQWPGGWLESEQIQYGKVSLLTNGELTSLGEVGDFLHLDLSGRQKWRDTEHNGTNRICLAESNLFKLKKASYRQVLPRLWWGARACVYMCLRVSKQRQEWFYYSSLFPRATLIWDPKMFYVVVCLIDFTMLP